MERCVLDFRVDLQLVFQSRLGGFQVQVLRLATPKHWQLQLNCSNCLTTLPLNCLNRPVSAFAEKYQRVDSARTECNRLMSLVCSLKSNFGHVRIRKPLAWQGIRNICNGSGYACVMEARPTSARSLLCRTFCSLSNMASGIVVTSFDPVAHF